MVRPTAPAAGRVPDCRKEPQTLDRLSFSTGAVVKVGLASAVALGAALWLRYGLIDVTAIAQACEAGERSLTCAVRFGFNEGFRTVVPGIMAVLIGLYALLRPGVAAFGATFVAAALCLVLFNAWPGALALTLALLSLARRAPASRARQA